MLPQTDYNVINSGTNGFSAEAGYNLVTGLGTPVANFLVPDLIAYQGPATIYSSPTVAALQSAGLVNTGSAARTESRPPGYLTDGRQKIEDGGKTDPRRVPPAFLCPPTFWGTGRDDTDRRGAARA